MAQEQHMVKKTHLSDDLVQSNNPVHFLLFYINAYNRLTNSPHIAP